MEFTDIAQECGPHKFEINMFWVTKNNGDNCVKLGNAKRTAQYFFDRVGEAHGLYEDPLFTNPDNGDKKSLRCNAIVAKVSIVDPECMMTMPKSVLASVGFDALCHCMEAYTSRIAQPFTDALSLYAIGLIAGNLVNVYNGNAGKEGWEKITLASTIGGMVINTAGVTLAHGMEHPASGLRDIVHGKGLAALTPAIIEASYTGNESKFADIAKLFVGKEAKDLALKIRELL